MTDALKGEPFTPHVFPLFLDAFKVLLQANFNGESSRSLSLFVTYALHDSRASYVKRPLRPKVSTLRLRKGATPALTPGSTPRSASPGQEPSSPTGLPLAELGVSVLKMLAELLCDPANVNEIIRFAKNVTGKVGSSYLSYLYSLTYGSGFCIFWQKRILGLLYSLRRFLHACSWQTGRNMSKSLERRPAALRF